MRAELDLELQGMKEAFKEYAQVNDVNNCLLVIGRIRALFHRAIDEIDDENKRTVAELMLCFTDTSSAQATTSQSGSVESRHDLDELASQVDAARRSKATEQE